MKPDMFPTPLVLRSYIEFMSVKLRDRIFFRKVDLIVIAILLLFALGFWGAFQKLSREHTEVQAHITYQGNLKLIIDLEDEPGIFFISEFPYIEFSLSQEGIAFIKSNCPDQICVNTGKIRHGGQFAACLPNEMILMIKPDGEGNIDAITR